MLFDRLAGFADLEMTTTTFRATVSEAAPFDFAAYAAQDLHASVRLTHLVYTPPGSAEEWGAYAASGPSPFTGSVSARVRGLGAGNAAASFVVAAFPVSWGRLAGRRARPSDVAAGLNVRLDVDGSAGLEVVGPGRVTFFGEQSSALIPEWMNHRIFAVGDNDEEAPEEDSSDEVDEMYRLVRY